MSLSTTEDIKARLDIVDIIGAYTQLKRAGANFKALCPFHSEKTPSFMVSKSKQLWYCFGACNEGGDMFKFIMKIEGVEFPDALKLLADKAGIELTRYNKPEENKKSMLLEIVKAAQEFYAAQLFAPEGADAHAYLAGRGLDNAIIKRFGLGYAPDRWDALISALRARFNPQDIFDAGMTIRSQRDQGFFDRFRQRIMFPIRDIHGNAIGFTSRLLDVSRKEGKYINTPETAIYNKGRVLYGLDFARDAIRKADYAVLVEGNMDVIACHQFGMQNVAATSGTAMTADQIRLLKRYSENLMVAFDTDTAGESAVKRGIDIALEQGMRIKVIVIPEGCGKDPDECLRTNPSAWNGAVRGAKEIMEYYFERAAARYEINTPHSRSKFVNLLLAEIARLPDLIEQDFWIKKLADRARIDEHIVREQLGRLTAPAGKYALRDAYTEAQSEPEVAATSLREKIAKRLFALFMHQGEALDKSALDRLSPAMFDPGDEPLYRAICRCYTEYNTLDASSIKTDEDANFRRFWRSWAAKNAPELLSTTDILELYGEEEFRHAQKQELLRERDFLVEKLRREYAQSHRRTLADRMRSAEAQNNTAEVEALTREFQAFSSGGQAGM